MSQDSLIGRTVAGYRLLQHVGEGGTATVYKAEHPERGLVALKVLRARLAQDPVADQALPARSGVRHPGQVTRTSCRPTTTARPRTSTTSPWSGSTARRWRSSPSAPAGWRPRWWPRSSSRSARRSTAAHAQSIIHRDLKPANIMYNPATQRAVLLDFGIARDADLKPEERLTRTGFFVGTLQYVAPEALSGELVNEQADVYSLATIAYYLLTGTLPYTGRSPAGAVPAAAHPAAHPAQPGGEGTQSSRPRSRRPSWPGLERDLTKRSKTVDEFTARLCTALRQTGERKELPQEPVRQMNAAGPRALDRLLLERSVRRGHFVLASGRTSSFYIDCRLTTMSAEGLVLIGRLGPDGTAGGRVGTRARWAASPWARTRWPTLSRPPARPPRPSSTPSASGRKPRPTAPGAEWKGISRRRPGGGGGGRDHHRRLRPQGDRGDPGGGWRRPRRPGGGRPGRRRPGRSGGRRITAWLRLLTSTRWA